MKDAIINYIKEKGIVKAETVSNNFLIEMKEVRKVCKEAITKGEITHRSDTDCYHSLECSPVVNKLEPGQIVEVYAKPLTKEMPEGEARLIKPVESSRDNENYENWKVVFLSDNFECERLINIK